MTRTRYLKDYELRAAMKEADRRLEYFQPRQVEGNGKIRLALKVGAICFLAGLGVGLASMPHDVVHVEGVR